MFYSVYYRKSPRHYWLCGLRTDNKKRAEWFFEHMKTQIVYAQGQIGYKKSNECPELEYKQNHQMNYIWSVNNDN